MKKNIFTLAFAVITLFVLAGCKKEPVPDVVPASGFQTSYEVPCAGQSIGGVKFNATAAWNATVAAQGDTQNWCTINPSSGFAGDVNATITVAENTGESPRSATVTITCGTKNVSITVNQAAADMIALAEGVSDVQNIDYPGGDIDIAVVANNTWTASSDKSWVTFNQVSNSQLKLTVAPNDGDARAAVVTLACGKSSVVVSVNQGGAPANLSAKGTANCYMVSGAGTYRFKPTKGNSAEAVSGIASLEKLWEYSIFGGTNAVISADGLEYKDGFIWLNATGTEGSASIAAKDASGKILWSWHIWVIKENPDITIGSTTLLTHNLGYIPWPANDAFSWGLLYQWGRKDPFGIKWATAITPANAFMTEASAADASTVGADGTTLDYSIAHPNVFISSNDNTCDWLTTDGSKQNKTLWGETKTIYDPCPVGYKVAPLSFYQSLDGSKIVAELSDIRHSMVYDGKLDFFYAGYIHFNKKWADWEYAGSWTWSANVPDGSPFAYSCFIIGGGMDPAKVWYRGNAMMVRCVKE